MIIVVEQENKKNANYSTSMTFEFEVWHWPYVKVMKAYVIRCRLLYCNLIPYMMSLGEIDYEIWTFIILFWRLTIACDLQRLSRSSKLIPLDVTNCMYLGTRLDVCEFTSLQDITICTFLWPLTFTCDLQRLSRSLSL